MNTWKPILAALVIFAAGVVTGGLTVRLAMPGKSSSASGGSLPLNVRGERGDLLNRMSRELYLTPDQRERVDTILRESQERTRQLWETIAPQARAEQRQVRERIREALNPLQRTKFDESFKVRGPGRLVGGDPRPREDGRKPEERRPRANREPGSEKTGDTKQ